MPSVTLPYPPSVNTYWRSLVIGGAARVVISERGRLYREAVQRAAREQWTLDMHQPIGTRLFVSIEVYPPNRRAFDIDNLCKSLLDAMTHAGFWVDDGQIDSLWVRRMTPIRGMVRVHFRAMTDGEVKALENAMSNEHDLTDEQCDRLVALTMDKLAAKHGTAEYPMHATNLNPSITEHHALRRSIVRTAYELGKLAGGMTPNTGNEGR